MQRILLFTSSFLIFAKVIFAQEYIWPTDASQLFTSSFAESRGGRFHAGFDVKTWGKTGYPIYAVRDGYISRIRVSPFGYGRALYLTLDTGEIAVYGHLEKFSDEIEAYVKAEQKRRNMYEIQLYPRSSQFRVKQGDLIALSGDSGVGYPHLHFELRDAASNPMNPLLKGYKVIDNIAPQITKILIQSMDALSSVNGDFIPRLFWPVYNGNGQYKVKDAIVVSGRIGFGIDTFDQMDSVSNKFGTYRNEVYVDDQLIFATQYDKFSYSVNNHFNLDRDYRQRIYGNGYIYNLFRDVGNKLSFYSSREPYAGVVDFFNSGVDSNRVEPGEIVEIPPGALKLDGGSHSFTITVKDFWGNTSHVSGRLVVDGESLFAQEQETPIDSLYGPIPPNSVITISDENQEVPKKDIKLDVGFYDRYLRIHLSSRIPLLAEPIVSGWRCSGKTYRMPLLQRSSSYIGAWPLSGCDSGPLPLSIIYVTQAGDTLMQNEWIEFATVPRGQVKSVLSDDGICKLDFATNSLFKDIFVRTTAILPDNKNEYDIVGNYYRIDPVDVPLDKGATLSLVYPDSTILPNKLGLYMKAGGSMRFVGNDKIHERRISGHISSFGTYALVRDIEPPVIYSLYPSNGSRTSQSTPTLRCIFKDNLSGIAGERNRILKLDGEKVIAEYDPEATAIFYTPENVLSKGQHTVEIVLKDQAGNVARQLNTFYVD
ncbi:M23 family metallopeptidase [candidate division KSB1 bacterium]|nr:M23 family metallopeptidase [candidate division KSB1 bacterium]RQW05221.1 MAG: M23 family metallopeptidase [candidate division KSB1 bacterium]